MVLGDVPERFQLYLLRPVINLLWDHVLSPNVTLGIYEGALHSSREVLKISNNKRYILNLHCGNQRTNRFPWNQRWVTSIDIMHVGVVGPRNIYGTRAEYSI